MAPEPSEHVSAAYWLLPLFFALIGGIIAYFVVKDRNKRTAQHLLIFGLIWTVLGVIVLIVIFAFIVGLMGGLAGAQP